MAEVWETENLSLRRNTLDLWEKQMRIERDCGSVEAVVDVFRKLANGLRATGFVLNGMSSCPTERGENSMSSFDFVH
eukprot:CAMPEP_0184679726 /NCGR_PEP_ID=MMETSP0312-20130426/2575_1 /TAXON_ID=31354 /ORGANISM="Compsopogon coeruleus, Strain SAG 36.94" /LENGTH=76 /DNA_ID=CAMNT_0027129351 /DNA_START=176 /DNA_END=406 /DNA_ORIENTATION=+